MDHVLTSEVALVVIQTMRGFTDSISYLSRELFTQAHIFTTLITKALTLCATTDLR